MDIEIARASDGDADRLLSLLESCDGEFDPPLSARVDLSEYVQKLLRSAIVIVARIHGEIAGFAAFYANDPSHKISFLSLILIDQQFRRYGLGRTLMEQWIKHCRQQRFRELHLEANAADTRLVEWYGQQGFKTVGHYARQGSHAVQMVLSLS